MIGRIRAGDRKLMLRVNRWFPPAWVRRWMILASRAGDGWIWAALGLIIMAFGGSHRIPALIAGSVAVLAGQLTFRALKRLTGRERPCATEPHRWATLLPPDRFSFPSGHTITAFAVVFSAGCYYPSWLPGLLFCALSVAASRILLGLHFLSDVLAGVLIGSGIGFWAFEWIGREFAG